MQQHLVNGFLITNFQGKAHITTTKRLRALREKMLKRQVMTLIFVTDPAVH